MFSFSEMCLNAFFFLNVFLGLSKSVVFCYSTLSNVFVVFFCHMKVIQEVLVLSVDCDNLLHARITCGKS